MAAPISKEGRQRLWRRREIGLHDALDAILGYEAALRQEEERSAELERRRDALLELVRSVSMEAPDAGEARDLRGQVAVLVAEVGTRRAQAKALVREHDALRRDLKAARRAIREALDLVPLAGGAPLPVHQRRLADRAAEVLKRGLRGSGKEEG